MARFYKSLQLRHCVCDIIRVRFGCNGAFESSNSFALGLHHVMQRFESHADYVLDVAPLVEATEKILDRNPTNMPPTG
jgi:hypothetical protein